MKFEASKVKPLAKGQSDKYSWNLYRVFKLLENEGKKHPVMDYRILYYEISPVDGSIVKFNPTDSLNAGHCFISRVFPQDQGTASRKISEIMGMSPSLKIDFFCYDSSLNPNHIVDITEWFWSEYVIVGRCIFDREHVIWWQGAASRFTQINKNSRKCNWCNQHQKKSIVKDVTIERREIWSA